MCRGPSRLYFLRHGLADRNAWEGDDDRLRPLTDEGVARMEAEASTLQRLDLECELIVTSPLTRCRQTAEIAAEALGLVGSPVEDAALEPGFDLEKLDDLLGRYQEHDTVMLVGHEPDFSMVVSQLTGGSDLVFKKGGLARVDLFAGSPPSGDLVWLVPPRILALSLDS